MVHIIEFQRVLKYWLEEDEKNLNDLNFSKLFPNFDLMPSDYLQFAEEELELIEKHPENVRLKINSILHLKRALDCQMDIFFYAFGLHEYIKRKNLGINTKLEFFKELGLINSRVIERFNIIRNRIEHNYKIPEINEVEVYYDLINSIISNIDKVIHSVATTSGNTRHSFENDRALEVVYERKNGPSVRFKVINENGEVYEGNSTIEDSREEFIYFLKVFIYWNSENPIKKQREKLLNSK
ncbi:hypothetical protein R0K17_11670 [Planococcus sp. SIMBA_143]